MKIQQTAGCYICQYGLQDGPDQDDYAKNWKQWHEHLLALEEQSEPWRLCQRKEPIVTHKVEDSNMVHWLCRECVYRHDPANGRFCVQCCPICRSDLKIPGREAGVEAGMDEYAHENTIDTFEFNNLDLGDDNDNSIEGESEGESDEGVSAGILYTYTGEYHNGVYQPDQIETGVEAGMDEYARENTINTFESDNLDPEDDSDNSMEGESGSESDEGVSAGILYTYTGGYHNGVYQPDQIMLARRH